MPAKEGQHVRLADPQVIPPPEVAEADVDDDAPRYNMSGQRVGNDYKGVVIVNGKKKVVR